MEAFIVLYPTNAVLEPASIVSLLREIILERDLLR
jgi:hypothetical protein